MGPLGKVWHVLNRNQGQPPFSTPLHRPRHACVAHACSCFLQLFARAIQRAYGRLPISLRCAATQAPSCLSQDPIFTCDTHFLDPTASPSPSSLASVCECPGVLRCAEFNLRIAALSTRLPTLRCTRCKLPPLLRYVSGSTAWPAWPGRSTPATHPLTLFAVVLALVVVGKHAWLSLRQRCPEVSRQRVGESTHMRHEQPANSTQLHRHTNSCYTRNHAAIA